MTNNPFDEIRTDRERRKQAEAEAAQKKRDEEARKRAEYSQPFLQAQEVARQKHDMVVFVLNQLKASLYPPAPLEIVTNFDISQILQADFTQINPYIGKESLTMATWELREEKHEKPRDDYDDGVRFAPVVTVTLEIDREKQHHFNCLRHDAKDKTPRSDSCGLSRSELTECLSNLYRD